MKQLAINNSVVFAPVASVSNQQPSHVYCSRRIGLYSGNTGLQNLNINEVFAKFAQLETEVNGNLIKMDEALHIALLGLLTGDNVFLLSLPGAAKSTMAGLIGQAIDGTFWRKNFTPGMDESDIYGPVSLSALSQNRFERAWAGLATAHYALCDEIFKADPRTLSLLLDAVEEKKLHGASGEYDMPLLGVISASNELTCANNQSAIWDRFGYRYEITRNNNAADVISMLGARGSNALISVRIDPEDIMLVQAYCEYMAQQLPQNILNEIGKLVKGLSSRGIIPSPRRWKVFARAIWAEFMLSVVKAQREGKQITKELNEKLLQQALRIGRFILWIEPEDRDAVEEILLQASSKARRVLIDAKARVEKVGNDANTSDPKKAQTYMKQIGVQIQNLKDIQKDPDISREEAEEASVLLQKAGEIQAELLANQTNMVFAQQN